MSGSGRSTVLGGGRPRRRAGAAVAGASGFVLALGFMTAPASAAPASPAPSSAAALANPAHHHTAGRAAPATVSPKAAVAAPAAAPAHTFHPVASASDAPQDAGHLNSGVCYSTNPSHNCTLRAAVMEANAEQKYIAIVLTSGTYHLTIPPANTQDASTGNLDITDPATVTFTGAGTAHTFVDGAGMSTGAGTGDRLFQLEQRAVARMTGFTVQHGAAVNTANNGDPGRGGGIDVSSPAASLVLQSMRVTASTADLNGGGIYADGTLWATQSALDGNTAQSGGGFYSFGTAQLVNDSFTGNSAQLDGGGIKIAGGGVAIQGGTVSGNHLVFPNGNTARGGGIYISEATTIVGTTISNNTIAPDPAATSGTAQGGGLYVNYGLDQADNLTIQGNSVAGKNPVPANSCCNGDGGGGIYDLQGFTLNNSVLSGNKAVDGVSGGLGALGGGLLNESDTEHLSHVTVSNNTADGDGGGILAYDITYVSQSTIIGNTSTGNGGGLWSDDGQQIDQTLIANNTAVQGGGIFNEWKMLLTNDTLTGNKATGTGNAGGALYNDGAFNSNSTAQLTNVTISGNRSDDGAGIAQFGGGVTVHNTIVAGNKNNAGNADRNCDISSSGATPLTDLGNNLDSGHTCGLTGPGDKQNTNPKLGALANNGGPTRTEALLSGSPAINAGSGPAPSTDQRGTARGNPPDMGAFETH